MRLKLKLRKTYFSIKWKLSRVFISKNNVRDVLPNHKIKGDDIKKSLILAPHADDEWIGCSQIIKKSKDITLYYFNFLGNNYSEENETVRLNELKNLQKKMGFKLVISEKNQNYTDLKKLIQENQFSSIFLPCPIDWHPEHIKVNNILLEILIELNSKIQLFFYKVSVPLPREMEIAFSPMSHKELKEKKEIFNQYYPSQKNVSIERLVLQNKLSAYKSNYSGIEPYGLLNFNIWPQLMKYINVNFNSEFQPMIHLIDYPIKIRIYVNKVYEKFLNSLNS